MQTSHLFLIDALESLNKELDSSLRLMFELCALGHTVFTAEPRQLAWHSLNHATATARAMTFGRNAKEFVAAPPAPKALGDFAAIHMRKDPPYDMDYIMTTWLLDAAPASTRIYNSPTALRTFNEKLAILRFPLATRPALVSADCDELLQFAETVAHGDAILKPLTLFGGRGVERLEVTKDRAKARQKLLEETANGTHLRLIQPFDPNIFQGEVRAFTAFGKAIAWCLKKPSAGQFLANTRAGATLHSYDPPPEVEQRITDVAAALLKEGVVFAGFDVIGGFVSEINITSPRLLTPPGDEAPYYQQLADMVRRDLA